MVSDFIFHLRGNQAYLRDVKTTNTCLLKLFVLTDILLAISDELKLIVLKFALPFTPIILLFALLCVLSVLNNTGRDRKIYKHGQKF